MRQECVYYLPIFFFPLTSAASRCSRLAVLRLAPNDPDAVQTKLFLLLQTDQYAAALALTQASQSKPEPDTDTDAEADARDRAFERAYALYRLHREEEAIGVLKELKGAGSDDESERGVMHLEAQLVRLSYRLNADVVLKVDGCRRTGKETTRPRLICTTNCWTQLNRCVSCFHLV